MRNKITTQYPLHHRQLEVEGISIHVVEGGTAEIPSVLFLHGWPENWMAFEQIMIPLSEAARVAAIDLPGIGTSETPPASNDKRTLARYVRGVIKGLNLQDVTLVGHDVGGMILYAYLHAYPNELRRAVFMNIAIPGVDPWSEVERNPHIWHFAFHAVPELPEKLVAGQQALYFAFFYERLSGPNAISKEARETYVEAYSRLDALHTGFDWYRAFPQDEQDNLRAKGDPVRTPVLYVRGECEAGDLERYLKGLREGGLHNVQGQLIPNSGHFAPEEQPGEVLAVLREFMGLAARS